MYLVGGQKVFFDIRVFDAHAEKHLNSSLRECYAQNEKEKKRQYNERVLQIEHGSSILLVYSMYEGISQELGSFYNRLLNLLSKKGTYQLR